MWPHIDTSRCTGCGWCVAACRDHVLSLMLHEGRKYAVLHDPAGCTACGKCERKCPHGVIDMRPSLQSERGKSF